MAAYDFELPTIINHTGAPSPAPTPFPPTPAPSNKNSLQHIINPKPQPYTVLTPRKHVIATALRQPLQLSTNKIEMFAPASFYDTTIQTGQMQSKVRSCFIDKHNLPQTIVTYHSCILTCIDSSPLLVLLRYFFMTHTCM